MKRIRCSLDLTPQAWALKSHSFKEFTALFFHPKSNQLSYLSRIGFNEHHSWINLSFCPAIDEIVFPNLIHSKCCSKILSSASACHCSPSQYYLNLISKLIHQASCSLITRHLKATNYSLIKSFDAPWELKLPIL